MMLVAAALREMNRAMAVLITDGPRCAELVLQSARVLLTNAQAKLPAEHAVVLDAWKVVDQVEDAIRQARELAAQPRRISEMYESQAIEESGPGEME